MFFKIDLLNKFKQGRFSEPWLAATCPTLFRRNYRKTHVLKMSVPKICDHIQEMWNTSSDQVNDRLSLFLAAQLLYGTVCIHQQQVQFLYETTLELYCLERELTKLIRVNFHENKKKPAKKLKQNYVLILPKPVDKRTENNFLMEDYGLIVCQTQQNRCDQQDLEKSVEELLQQPDVVSVPNASITLVEEPITTSPHDMVVDIIETEQQIFNSAEYCEFMNFNEEPQQAKRAKLHDTASSMQEVPLEKQTKIVSYSNTNLHESSLDLINRINRSANPLTTTNSFDNFYPNTGSTPMRELNHRDPLLDHFGIRSKPQNSNAVENTEDLAGFVENQLPSIVDPIPNQTESVIEQIQLPSIIDPIQQTSTVKPNELTQPKNRIAIAPSKTTRGKTKKKLLVDSVIEISDKCFYSHIQDYTSTLRALHPTDDIMSMWKIELKRDIFHMPADKILAIPLYQNYKNCLITKPMTVDNDIFGNLLNPFEVTPPRQLSNKRRGKKRTHDDQIVKTIEQPIIPEEIPLQMVIEVNPPSRMPIRMSFPVEPTNLVIPVIETTEISTLFPSNMAELSDSTAKEQFGKSEIYRYLEVLWGQNIYPIGMGRLCAGLKKRKYVAMVFYSLMCLHNDGKIKLIPNLNDREIYHIQSVD